MAGSFSGAGGGALFEEVGGWVDGSGIKSDPGVTQVCKTPARR